MGCKVYIDGKFYEKDAAKISVFDHGLLYGDGVFEGIRSYKGLIFKCREHIDRLYESAHTLKLSIPLRKEEMIKALVRTLQVNKLTDAYIRLVVTRGPGDLGLDPRKCPRASVIIIAAQIVLYPERLYREGLKIITVPTVRNLAEALNPQIKSLNYLNNVLAKIEAVQAGFEEAIMLNAQGYVAECTGDNLFMIKQNCLYTPPQSMGILRGITRDSVLALAQKAKICAREVMLTRHEIFNSDEVFLTGTAAEIIPVVEVDSRVIGTGSIGPLTKRLMKAFHRATKTDGVRYRVA